MSKLNSIPFNKQNPHLKHERFEHDEACIERLFSAEPYPECDNEITLNDRDVKDSRKQLLKQIRSYTKKHPHLTTIPWIVPGDDEATLDALRFSWTNRGFCSTPVKMSSMVPYCDLVFLRGYIPNAFEVNRHFRNGTAFLHAEITAAKFAQPVLHSHTRLTVLWYNYYCASRADMLTPLFKHMLLNRRNSTFQGQGFVDGLTKRLTAWMTARMSSALYTNVKSTIGDAYQTCKNTILSVYTTIREKVIEFFRATAPSIANWWQYAALLIVAISASVVFVAFAHNPLAVGIAIGIFCAVVGCTVAGSMLQNAYGRKKLIADVPMHVQLAMFQLYCRYCDKGCKFDEKPRDIEREVDFTYIVAIFASVPKFRNHCERLAPALHKMMSELEDWRPYFVKLIDQMKVLPFDEECLSGRDWVTWRTFTMCPMSQDDPATILSAIQLDDKTLRLVTDPPVQQVPFNITDGHGNMIDMQEVEAWGTAIKADPPEIHTLSTDGMFDYSKDGVKFNKPIQVLMQKPLPEVPARETKPLPIGKKRQRRSSLPDTFVLPEIPPDSDCDDDEQLKRWKKVKGKWQVKAQGDDKTPFTIAAIAGMSTAFFGDAAKSVNNAFAPFKELNAFFSTCKTVKDFVGSVIEHASTFIDAAAQFSTGHPYFTKSKEIHALSNLIRDQTEILGRENIRTDMTSDPAVCRLVVDAYQTILRYKQTAGNTVMRNLGFAQEINRMQMAYMPLYHEAMQNLRQHKTRIEPYWLYMYGIPHQGKTKFMEVFVPAVYENLTGKKWNNNSKYERKLDQEFWDAYHGQWCTTVDDVFQVKDKEKRTTAAMEFIYMVNTNPFPLHMASLEDKGMTSFESKFIISSTNAMDLPRELGITDPESLYRRMGMRVQMTATEKFGVKTDAWTPADFLKWNFDIRGKTNSVRVNYDQLVQLIVRELQEREKAAQQMDKYMSTMDSSHCMLPKNYLDPVKLKRILAQGMGGSKLQYISGKYSNGYEPVEYEDFDPFDFTLSKQAMRTRYEYGNFRLTKEFARWAKKEQAYVMKNIDPALKAICLANQWGETKAWDFIVSWRSTNYHLLFHGDWLVTGKPTYDWQNNYPNSIELGKAFGVHPNMFQSANVIAQQMAASDHIKIYSVVKTDTPDSEFYTWFESLDLIRKVNLKRLLKQKSLPNASEEFTMFPKMHWHTTCWHYYYKFAAALGDPAVSSVILGVTTAAMGILAVVLAVFISRRKMGIEAQSEDNKETRDRTMTRMHPFGKAPAVLVNGARIKLQTSDQGSYEVATRAVGNSYPFTVTYADGATISAILFFVKGRIAVCAAHMFEYPSTVDSICIYQISVEDKAAVEVYSSHELSFVKYPERDVTYIAFKGRAHMKDMTPHMPSRGDDLSGYGPARCEFNRGALVITKGSVVDCIRDIETEVTINGKTMLKDVQGAFVVRECAGFAGACGFTYVMFNNKFEKKLPFIHIGGVGRDSIVAPIYVDDIEGKFTPQDHIPIGDPVLPEGGMKFKYTAESNELPGTRHVGNIDYTIHLPSKTKLVPSLFQEGIIKPDRTYLTCPYPIQKAPAKLAPFRNADGVLIKPRDVALAKYKGTKANKMDPLLTHPGNFKGVLNAGMPHRLHKILTVEETLNGKYNVDVPSFSLAKSSGPGFAERGVKLKDMVERDPFKICGELQRQLDEQERMAKAGIMPPAFATLCLKDETRPIDRVASGNSRLFAVMEKAHTIRCKMYCGTMKEAICAYPTESDIALGINAHSTHWGLLYRRLFKHGAKTRLIAFDTPAWDMNFVYRIAPFVSEEMCHILGIDKDSEWGKQIYILVTSTLHAYYVLGNRVFSKSMMPSGSWFTSLLNSIVNSICFRYAWRKLITEAPDDFDKWCALAVFGDDSGLGVHVDFGNRFNAITISKLFYQQFNWNITNPDKTPIDKPFVDEKDFVFLQRKFRIDPESPNCVFAPLERASIYSMCQWVRADEKPLKDQTVENLRTACSEWFHHGKDVFNVEVPRLNEFIRLLDPKKVYTETYNGLMLKYINNQFQC